MSYHQRCVHCQIEYGKSQFWGTACTCVRKAIQTCSGIPVQHCNMHRVASLNEENLHFSIHNYCFLADCTSIIYDYIGQSRGPEAQLEFWNILNTDIIYYTSCGALLGLQTHLIIVLGRFSTTCVEAFGDLMELVYLKYERQCNSVQLLLWRLPLCRDTAAASMHMSETEIP